MLFANSNFKDLLVECALFNSGIEIKCVSEHVWVGHGGLRGRGGELPAGGIRASQGTFSTFLCFFNKFDVSKGKKIVKILCLQTCSATWVAILEYPKSVTSLV